MKNFMEVMLKACIIWRWDALQELPRKKLSLRRNLEVF
jgi:hypothetical protein